MISVLVLTKNEQQDLPGCLQSVSWCDDIHVFDSGSTDATEDVARAHGAKITRRVCDDRMGIFGGDESEHRNWGLRNIPFAHPWVFMLDADERMSPTLAVSARDVVAASTDQVAYQVQRRDFLFDTWLKHAQASPYYLRLFRPERLRYERLINPVSIPDGPVGEIVGASNGYLDHYPFSKGMSHWLTRHNHYSTLEAQQIVKTRLTEGSFTIAKALTASNFNERRFHQKELFYRMPARPLLRFAYLYMARRGFLDGYAGFSYSVLQGIYEYMIVLKTRELKQRIMPRSEQSKSPSSHAERKHP